MKPQAAADSVFDADGFFTQSDDEFLRDIGFSLRDLDLDQDARLAA